MMDDNAQVKNYRYQKTVILERRTINFWLTKPIFIVVDEKAFSPIIRIERHKIYVQTLTVEQLS